MRRGILVAIGLAAGSIQVIGIAAAEDQPGRRSLAMLEVAEPRPGGEAMRSVNPALVGPAAQPGVFTSDQKTQAIEMPAVKQPESRPEEGEQAKKTIAQPMNGSGFALGPGDQIKITVWGYPELSEQIIIPPGGQVSYPLVGIVQVKGLSTEELAEKLRQALEQQIESPQVSVVVTDMRSRRFSVIGAVGKTGTYPLWDDHVTVLEAIAEAGGLDRTAIPDQIKVFRVGQGGAGTAVPVDLTSILGERADYLKVTLQPGDVVYVPSQSARRGVCILGEVNTPGLYTLTPNMTVIEALSTAGWAKPSGVLRSVMVARQAPDGAREFYKVDARRAVVKQDWSQHVVLRPGDIIYVPEKFIAQVGDFVSFFTSKVEPAAHTYLRLYDATNPANVLIDR